MKYLITLILFFMMTEAFSAPTQYKVRQGQFHKGGKITVEVLPTPDKFEVKMVYAVKKRVWVPVPSSLLEGTKVMAFPEEFRTEEGYKKLEAKKTMDIPKAQLKFLKRADVGPLKNGYLIKVLPTNKKSEIEILYHPELPGVGWERVEIVFISNIPLLGGYKLVAHLKK